MARVGGPLFSLNASGSVAKTVTYAVWKGIAYVREWFRPQNPKTVNQIAQRLIFSQAVVQWHDLSTEIKLGWDAGSIKKGKTQSGFNYHNSEYIKAMLAGETPPTESPL